MQHIFICIKDSLLSIDLEVGNMILQSIDKTDRAPIKGNILYDDLYFSILFLNSKQNESL